MFGLRVYVNNPKRRVTSTSDVRKSRRNGKICTTGFLWNTAEDAMRDSDLFRLSHSDYTEGFPRRPKLNWKRNLPIGPQWDLIRNHLLRHPLNPMHQQERVNVERMRCATPPAILAATSYQTPHCANQSNCVTPICPPQPIRVTPSFLSTMRKPIQQLCSSRQRELKAQSRSYILQHWNSIAPGQDEEKMKEFLSTTFNLREQTNTKQANLMDLIKNLYAHEGSVETQMQFGSLLHAAKYTRKEIMQLLNVTIVCKI